MEHREEEWVGMRPELLRYCRKLCGDGAQGWQAEDIAQETIAKLWTRCSEEPGFVPTKPYALRTARNLWIDRLRKRGEIPFGEVPEIRRQAGGQPTAATRELLESLLDRLAPKAFVLLLLCDVFGFTAKEAASRLDATEGAVQVALSRARARLRRLASEADDLSGREPSVRQQGADADLLDEVSEAFRRHDPYRIYKAYLSLYESGSALIAMQSSSDGLLTFTFRDPEGNLFRVTG